MTNPVKSSLSREAEGRLGSRLARRPQQRLISCTTRLSVLCRVVSDPVWIQACSDAARTGGVFLQPGPKTAGNYSDHPLFFFTRPLFFLFAASRNLEQAGFSVAALRPGPEAWQNIPLLICVQYSLRVHIYIPNLDLCIYFAESYPGY